MTETPPPSETANRPKTPLETHRAWFGLNAFLFTMFQSISTLNTVNFAIWTNRAGGFDNVVNFASNVGAKFLENPSLDMVRTAMAQNPAAATAIFTGIAAAGFEAAAIFQIPGMVAGVAASVANLMRR